METEAHSLLERWIFILVRVEAEFSVPYTDGEVRRIAEKGGYGERFMPFLHRFMEALREPGFQPGSYYPGGWFRSLEAQDLEPQTAPITPESLHAFFQDEVRIERDGRWLVGPKLIEGRVLQHFLKHLEFDSALERYRIRYRLEQYYETRYIHPLTPPYRVEAVVTDNQTLLLNDGSREPLRPESLRLDNEEQLYAAVTPQHLPALFEDNARWQVLQRVDETPQGWVLHRGGRDIPLQLDAPRPYAGDVM